MGSVKTVFGVLVLAVLVFVAFSLARNYKVTGDMWTHPSTVSATAAAEPPAPVPVPAPPPAPAPVPVAAAAPPSGPSWTFGGLVLETVVVLLVVPLVVIVGFAGGGTRYAYASSQHISVDGRLLGWTNTRVPVSSPTAPTGMTNGVAFFIWVVCVVMYYCLAYLMLDGYPLVHVWSAGWEWFKAL